MKLFPFVTATLGRHDYGHEQHGVQCHSSRCRALCMFCAENGFAVMMEQQQLVKGVPQSMYNKQRWLTGGP